MDGRFSAVQRDEVGGISERSVGYERMPRHSMSERSEARECVPEGGTA